MQRVARSAGAEGGRVPGGLGAGVDPAASAVSIGPEGLKAPAGRRQAPLTVAVDEDADALRRRHVPEPVRQVVVGIGAEVVADPLRRLALAEAAAHQASGAASGDASAGAGSGGDSASAGGRQLSWPRKNGSTKSQMATTSGSAPRITNTAVPAKVPASTSALNGPARPRRGPPARSASPPGRSPARPPSGVDGGRRRSSRRPRRHRWTGRPGRRCPTR